MAILGLRNTQNRLGTNEPFPLQDSPDSKQLNTVLTDSTSIHRFFPGPARQILVLFLILFALGNTAWASYSYSVVNDSPVDIHKPRVSDPNSRFPFGTLRPLISGGSIACFGSLPRKVTVSWEREGVATSVVVKVRKLVKMTDRRRVGDVHYVILPDNSLQVRYRLETDAARGPWVIPGETESEARRRKQADELVKAAARGDIQTVRELLEAGAPASPESFYHGNPLSRAAKAGHLEVVNALLEHGAAIETPHKYGTSALSSAILSGKTRIAETLLEAGADINYRGDPPLIAAATKNRIQLAKTLLRAGAEANVTSNVGQTPMSCAIREKHLPMVKLLGEHGIHGLTVWNSDTLLNFARKNSTPEIAAWLEQAANEASKDNKVVDTLQLRDALGTVTVGKPNFGDSPMSVVSDQVSPKITHELRIVAANGDAAVLIATRIRDDLPKDDSILERVAAKNGDYKGTGLENHVLTRYIEYKDRRAFEFILLNSHYDSSFPYGLGLGSTGEKIETIGIRLFIVHDDRLVEFALHLNARKDENETKEAFIARSQKQALEWAKTITSGNRQNLKIGDR